MKYSICITSPEVGCTIPVALLEGSFRERLRKAADFGYDGIELLAAEPQSIDVPSLKEMVVSHGIEVSAISSGALALGRGLTLLAADEATRLVARKRLSELVVLASELGSPVVTVGSFRGRAAAVGGVDNARRLLAEVLGEAADFAARLGVTLALEPINRWDTDYLHNAQETIDFIESVGTSALGLLLDTFHMNVEEASFENCFRSAALRGLLHHVHLGDSNRLLPGQGHIDFASILRTLREAGYQGYLSMELLAGTSPDEAGKESIDAMRRFS